MSEPPGPAGKANARGEGGSITGAVRRGGVGARDTGRAMGEETSGNEGFRKKNEVLESRRSSVSACEWPSRKDLLQGRSKARDRYSTVSRSVECSIWGSCSDSFLGPSCETWFGLDRRVPGPRAIVRMTGLRVVVPVGSAAASAPVDRGSFCGSPTLWARCRAACRVV